MLPFGPLHDFYPHDSSAELAARFGVTRRTVQRWRAGGLMRLRIAEDLCDRAGLHPFEVWGPEYYDTAALVDETSDRRYYS